MLYLKFNTMAQAIDFEQRNDYIGKPENQSNHQCYALPVARILQWIPGVIPAAPPQQVHSHVSCWLLSDEEVEEVKRTGRVYVRIQGVTTFPISIWGKLPIHTGEGNLSDHLFTEQELQQLKNKSNPEER